MEQDQQLINFPHATGKTTGHLAAMSCSHEWPRVHRERTIYCAASSGVPVPSTADEAGQSCPDTSKHIARMEACMALQQGPGPRLHGGQQHAGPLGLGEAGGGIKVLCGHHLHHSCRVDPGSEQREAVVVLCISSLVVRRRWTVLACVGTNEAACSVQGYRDVGGTPARASPGGDGWWYTARRQAPPPAASAPAHTCYSPAPCEAATSDEAEHCRAYSA